MRRAGRRKITLTFPVDETAIGRQAQGYPELAGIDP